MSVTVPLQQRRHLSRTSEGLASDRVELQLLTTLKCNLKCTYCSISEGDVLGSLGNVSYDLAALDRFVATHLGGKDVYVTFYGGEPTLNRPFMEEVMRRYPQFRFQLQTNGTLLDDLPAWVLQRLSNILVSIDGGEATTDGYRGRGIYKQIRKNLAKVHDQLGGSVTARMTWSSETIGFEEIDELANSFDYLYFQFVAGDAYRGESLARRKVVLDQLVERFFARTDALYPVIPLMGIVRNKLAPAVAAARYAGRTQCRASSHLLNVMPDGRIYACPDLMHLPEMQMGDIGDNWLRNSPLQPTADMPCHGCAAQAWCRGNCMKNLYLGYVRKDRDWREQVTDPVCELVRHLGETIDRHDPQAWFARLPLPLRRQITDSEVYDYVEIMP